MTELLNSLGEFFKSPLGVILLSVLAAVGASAISRLRARTDRQNQIDKAVGESEAKTKTIMLEREAQSLKLIDAIREDWVQSQRDIAEIRTRYDAVVERNIQLISEQRMSLEAINRLTNELEDCNVGTAKLQADAAKLHSDFETMLEHMNAVQEARSKVQAELTKRNGEYDQLDATLAKRNREFMALSDKFEAQKIEIEHLQSDLWEVKRNLAETKARLTTLENKPADAGQDSTALHAGDTVTLLLPTDDDSSSSLPGLEGIPRN